MSYLNPEELQGTTAERQERLLDGFGFTCTCRRCSENIEIKKKDFERVSNQPMATILTKLAAQYTLDAERITYLIAYADKLPSLN